MTVLVPFTIPPEVTTGWVLTIVLICLRHSSFLLARLSGFLLVVCSVINSVYVFRSYTPMVVRSPSQPSEFLWSEPEELDKTTPQTDIQHAVLWNPAKAAVGIMGSFSPIVALAIYFRLCPVLFALFINGSLCAATVAVMDSCSVREQLWFDQRREIWAKKRPPRRDAGTAAMPVLRAKRSNSSNSPRTPHRFSAIGGLSPSMTPPSPEMPVFAQRLPQIPLDIPVPRKNPLRVLNANRASSYELPKSPQPIFRRVVSTASRDPHRHLRATNSHSNLI